MDNLIKSFENEKVVLSIYYDTNPMNPREWDNLGTMVCWHRRYDLGDERARNIELYNSWDEWLENEILIPNGGEENVIYLPLYLYDHGGITMNTTGFSCPWDSGQVGWIYTTYSEIEREFGQVTDEVIDKVKNILRNEVRIYDDYLRGEVYGFILEEKKTCDCCGHVEYEEIDSYWGFYGDDLINSIKEYVPREYRDLFEEAV